MSWVLQAVRWLGLPASAISTLAMLAVLGALVTAGTRRLGIAALLVGAAGGLWVLSRRLGTEEAEPTRRAQSWFGQRSLARNTISSGIATSADFVMMTALVAVMGLYVPIATFLGCAVGAVVNFTVNWSWAFGSDAALVRMAPRYVFVSASGALLNAGLVAAVLLLPDPPYQLAWAGVRVVVFVLWSYPLNRDYVFTSSEGTLGG